jgi:hypothetical protein
VHPKASVGFARFEVLTVMLLRNQVFWDMMLCCNSNKGLLASEDQARQSLEVSGTTHPTTVSHHLRPLTFPLSLCPGVTLLVFRNVIFVVCCVCTPFLIPAPVSSVLPVDI